MNQYASAQLAEYRRQQLTADATYYRHTRGQRTRPGTRRPFAAFQSWLASGQL
jgi:hypothetical protein